MQRDDATQATDLREFLATLRVRKWTILLAAGIVVAAVLTFSFRQTPTYISRTRVLVLPVGPNPQITSLVNLETERALVESSAVASKVRETVGATSSTESILRRLDVSVESDTEILAIDYSDPDPIRAQEISQAFADAYAEFREEQALEQIQVRLTAAEARISMVETDIAKLDGRIAAATVQRKRDQLSAERGSLVARLGLLQLESETLRANAGIEQSGAKIIQPATLPTSRSTPNHVRNGAIAIVLGLTLGLGLAFLREQLDDRLRGGRDLGQQIEAPVLANVPRVEGWKRKGPETLISVSRPRSPPAEAYKTLRTNLEFIASNGDFRILEVTSAFLGEGKTTTVANLAVALSQAGRRVIAVSCDLRKPRLHRFFQLHNQSGLTSILRGEASLEQAAQSPGLRNLRVLASGPVPRNPAELLGSPQMEALLAELRGRADFVVLDTPPLLAVSDALVLAPQSDGVLIVADSLATTRGAAARGREQLENVGGRIVGGVYNNFDPTAARTYPYYYGYYYRSGYDEEAKRERDDGGFSQEQADAGPSWQRAAADLWS